MHKYYTTITSPDFLSNQNYQSTQKCRYCLDPTEEVLQTVSEAEVVSLCPEKQAYMENNLIYTVAWNNYLTESFLITLQFRVPLYNPHIMPTTWYVSHTIIVLNNVENVFLKVSIKNRSYSPLNLFYCWVHN